MKLFLGCVYTVISVSITTGIVFWLGGSSVMSRTDVMLQGAQASAVISIIFVILWGLPTHFLFVKIKIYSIKWYALSGFVTGPLFVFVTKPFGNDPFLDKVIQSTYCGVIGAVGAMVFWWFVARNNSHNKSLNKIGEKDAPTS